MQTVSKTPGLQIIAVGVGENALEAAKWHREYQASFPVIPDPQREISRPFGFDAIPYNVVIDRQGNVVETITGADLDAIQAAVQKAVKS